MNRTLKTELEYVKLLKWKQMELAICLAKFSLLHSKTCTHIIFIDELSTDAACRQCTSGRQASRSVTLRARRPKGR